MPAEAPANGCRLSTRRSTPGKKPGEAGASTVVTSKQRPDSTDGGWRRPRPCRRPMTRSFTGQVGSSNDLDQPSQPISELRQVRITTTQHHLTGLEPSTSSMSVPGEIQGSRACRRWTSPPSDTELNPYASSGAVGASGVNPAVGEDELVVEPVGPRSCRRIGPGRARRRREAGTVRR